MTPPRRASDLIHLGGGRAATRYRVVDMHTAGEPVRIVVEGGPELTASTLLEKRAEAAARHDLVRRRLVLEPRGHSEMYGVLLAEPDDKRADLAALFMHVSGYSTMCGHATIALGRWAVDAGLVVRESPSTPMALQCPCGIVDVIVHTQGASAGLVEFDSVPAFAERIDATEYVPGVGPVRFDVAFGGAYYAILPASRLGAKLGKTPLNDLVGTARRITDHLRRTITLRHPGEADLGFLYGTILTDDLPPVEAGPSYNLCVFGEGQVDRSPTGSGVTARAALAFYRGTWKVGASQEFRGPTDIGFGATIIEALEQGAVRVRVGGRAHYAGVTDFVVEEDDPLREGISLVRQDDAAVFPSAGL